ncbi:3'-5' exonuclease [Streptomyces sp. AJS327]|uniref:3'-5' exonuclease n=1 Tax=Streptomyces sp. AJS327 TaxID=2545265 RepID=UPI0015E039F1|nr:3'-5' exonuclease [Streptomyces sp. AJS327]MBA0050778.1 3'-5' exonuclease [Streptomyces sp. AJS327]
MEQRTPWYEAPLAALAVRGRRSAREGGGAPERPDEIHSAALVTQSAPGDPVSTLPWRLVAAPDGGVGRDGTAEAAVRDLVRCLGARATAGTPVVLMDAPHELTLLDRELRRRDGSGLTGHLGSPLHVLDPLVLDRHLDRGRTGPRVLDTLCVQYGVTPPRTTDPAGRARAALEVVRALGRRFAPRLASLTPAELHSLQAVWFGAQTRGLATTPGEGAARPTPAWPLRDTEPATAPPL